MNNDLEKYIKENILEKYKNTKDLAHDKNHINRVINRSLKIGEYYKLNKDMLYTQASYHDIASEEDRKNHHILGARIIKNDKELKRFFSENEIDIMAKSIETHRASSKEKPKDIYGKILSDADRDTNVEVFLKRSYEYRKLKNSVLDFESCFEDVYNHYIDKYSEKGYMKFNLENEYIKNEYSKFLKFMNDKERVKEKFNEIWLSLE